MKSSIIMLIALFTISVASAQTENKPQNSITIDARMQQRTNQVPAIPNQTTETQSELKVKRDNTINGTGTENSNAVRPSVSGANTENGVSSPIGSEPPSSTMTTAPGGGGGTTK